MSASRTYLAPISHLQRRVPLQWQYDPREGEPVQVVSPPPVLKARLLIQKHSRQLGQRLDGHREGRLGPLVESKA
jgi:hypothetical protein